MSRTTVATLATDVNELRKDVNILQTNVNSMQSDIQEIKDLLKGDKKSRTKWAPEKSSSKKKAPAKQVSKPVYATRGEAIDAWCGAKGISYAARDKFGQDAKKVRETLMATNERIGKGNTGYLYGKAWKEAFNAEWEKLGYEKPYYKN